MGLFDKITYLFGARENKKPRVPAQRKVDARNQSHLEKKEIHVSRLQKGMTVVDLDRPWTDLPVAFQEITIKKDSEIEMLQKYCNKVFIDSHSYRTIYAESLIHKKRKVIYQKPDLSASQESEMLRQEMPKAKKTFLLSQSHINQLMLDVERDGQIDIQSSKQLVNSCVDSILSNETAMFWLTKIKDKDQYTSEHCVRVGILAIAFGKYLQLAREDLEIIGLCGMLHDVGKMKVPQHILHKEGKLTSDEYNIIKEHTVLGYVFLKNHGDIPEEVCSAAYNHHERLNGKGYPRQLERHNLTMYDKIIAIVDSYDAMISDRCYRKGMPPSKALAVLYKNRDELFDSELVQIFIKMVGVYPVGSLVELNTKQIAIVLSVNENHKLHPVIEILTDENHHLIEPASIDLSEQDEGDENYQIKRTLSDNDVQFDIKKYIKNVA